MQWETAARAVSLKSPAPAREVILERLSSLSLAR